MIPTLDVPQTILQRLVDRRTSFPKTDDAGCSRTKDRRVGEDFEAQHFEGMSDEGSMDSHEDVAEELAGVEGPRGCSDVSGDVGVVELDRSRAAAEFRQRGT